MYDHCYIGGGNAARITGDLPEKVTIVSNDAGILGGIKLWDATRHQGAPAGGPARTRRSGARSTGSQTA
jgi:hypothetical protein